MSNHETDYLCALYDVARTINSTLDLPEVLERIVKSAAEALDAKAASVRLLSSDRRRLVYGAQYGLSQDYLQKGAVELEKSAVDREVLEDRPVYIANVSEDRRFQYPERARQEGIVSLLVVPLETRGRVIGVMRVYTSERRQFSDKESEFLSLIAGLSAVAIDNARLYQVTKEDYETLLSFQDRIFNL